MATVHAEWSRLIPDDEWSLYESVMNEADARGIPYAMGGGWAMATYTGWWRDTKDLDLYVLPEHRDRMVEMLTGMGFRDYFETKPYDRWWIYRATTADSIVDVIWAMANHRAEIDDFWMSGPTIEIRGRNVKVVSPECMFWDKLYIVQRDRCDWPDVLNLLYAVGPLLKWDPLLDRIGGDCCLAAAALAVFRWIAPGAAERIPPCVWERLGMRPVPSPGSGPEIETHHVQLLDRRPWFGSSGSARTGPPPDAHKR